MAIRVILSDMAGAMRKGESLEYNDKSSGPDLLLVNYIMRSSVKISSLTVLTVGVSNTITPVVLKIRYEKYETDSRLLNI